jgi:hypothetical protein
VVRSTVAALVLVVGSTAGVLVALVAGARPALACDCGSMGDVAALEHADVVFSGEWVASVPPSPPPFGPSDAEIRYVFAVDAVHRGEAFEHQSVLTRRGGVSCGLELDGPGPYLVFARTTSWPGEPVPAPGELVADLCGGTRPLAIAPLPVELAVADAPRAGASPTSGESDRDLLWTLAVGAALGASVVMGVRALRQLRRRPPDDEPPVG